MEKLVGELSFTYCLLTFILKLLSTSWGTVRIPENVSCFMIVFQTKKVIGHCTMGGHCWTRYGYMYILKKFCEYTFRKETKLLHPECREKL